MTTMMNEWQRIFGSYHGSIITLAVNVHGAAISVNDLERDATVRISADGLLSLVDSIVDGATKKYEKHILEQNKIVAEQEGLIHKLQLSDMQQMSEEILALNAQVEELTGQLKAMASLKESVIASLVQQNKESQ